MISSVVFFFDFVVVGVVVVDAAFVEANTGFVAVVVLDAVLLVVDDFNAGIVDEGLEVPFTLVVDEDFAAVVVVVVAFWVDCCCQSIIYIFTDRL